jgi:hypothetical protein
MTRSFRFLGGALHAPQSAGAFQPGGPLSFQAGRRTVKYAKRDWLLWNIGLDHSQRITWLNPNNSFTPSSSTPRTSAQNFMRGSWL